MNAESLLFITKTAVSALLIAGASSLAQRHPILAGYITALPLTSILVLSFAYAQSGDGANTSRFAVSIFAALPVTLLFFTPFLLYDRLKGSLWWYLLAGLALLAVGYFVQRALARWLLAAG